MSRDTHAIFNDVYCSNCNKRNTENSLRETTYYSDRNSRREGGEAIFENIKAEMCPELYAINFILFSIVYLLKFYQIVLITFYDCVLTKSLVNFCN